MDGTENTSVGIGYGCDGPVSAAERADALDPWRPIFWGAHYIDKFEICRLRKDYNQLLARLRLWRAGVKR